MGGGGILAVLGLGAGLIILGKIRGGGSVEPEGPAVKPSGATSPGADGSARVVVHVHADGVRKE